MHRISSTHVVLTLLSWEWAAAGTHPARSARIKGTIYLPHNPEASNKLPLIKPHWPADPCSHPPSHIWSLYPLPLLCAPNTNTHFLPKYCFSASSIKGSVWVLVLLKNNSLHLSEQGLFTVWGFWRVLYDLAVGLILPSVQIPPTSLWASLAVNDISPSISYLHQYQLLLTTSSTSITVLPVLPSPEQCTVQCRRLSNAVDILLEPSTLCSYSSIPAPCCSASW